MPPNAIKGTLAALGPSIELPALYVDSVALVAATPRLVLVNRDPSPGETGVPIDATLALELVDTGPDGVERSTARVWIDGVLAFDGSAVPELAPAFAAIESGGHQLKRNADGAFVPRILVTFRHDSQRPLRKVGSIEVQYREETAPRYLSEVFSNDNLKAWLTEVETGKTYEIRARFRYISGGKSGWAGPVLHTVVGPTDPPPDAEWVRVENDDTITWRYNNPPVDHRGFMVRWGPLSLSNWDEAKKAHDGVIRTTEFPLKRIPAHARCVLVKAVDASGNLSLNPGRCYLVTPEEEPWRVLASIDLAAANYPGTLQKAFRTGAVGRVGPELIAVTTSAFRTGLEPAFVEEGAVAFVEDVRATYIYEARFTVPSAAVKGDRMRVLLKTDDSNEVEVTYRTSDAVTIGRPFSNGRKFSTGHGWVSSEQAAFAPLPQYILLPEANVTVILRFKGTATLTGLLVKFYARMQTERLESLTLPVAGVKLPLTKAWRRIATVNATIVGDNNPLVTVKIKDKTDLATGLEIERLQFTFGGGF